MICYLKCLIQKLSPATIKILRATRYQQYQVTGPFPRNLVISHSCQHPVTPHSCRHHVTVFWLPPLIRVVLRYVCEVEYTIIVTPSCPACNQICPVEVFTISTTITSKSLTQCVDPVLSIYTLGFSRIPCNNLKSTFVGNCWLTNMRVLMQREGVLPISIFTFVIILHSLQ